jgi:hypothetical protein
MQLGQVWRLEFMEQTELFVDEVLKTMCIASSYSEEDKSLLPPARIVELVNNLSNLSSDDKTELATWIEEMRYLQKEAAQIVGDLPLFNPRSTPPSWFGHPWVIVLQCPWAQDMPQAVEQGRRWLAENQ